MLKLTERNTMIVITTPGGDEVGCYYRQPTTQEIHKYQSESVQRKRNAVVFRHSEAQLKYGKMILTGLRDKDCCAPNAAGEIVDISSDSKSPHYREDWKELLERYAPNVIMALGAYVFGGTEAGQEEDDEDLSKN